MKLFKVKRTDKWTWDDYDSFICFANNEEEARWMAPDPEYHMWKDGVYCYSYREQEPVNSDLTSWVKDPKTQLVVTEITVPSEPTVLSANFNPG